MPSKKHDPGSPPRSRWVEVAFLAILFAVAAPRFIPRFAAAVDVGGLEGEVPTWTVTTLDGQALTSSELRGRVVVVNFWATWCPPCRVELPTLDQMWERERNAGLVVLGLSTDVGGEDVIRAFLDDHGIGFPVARATAEVRRAFGGVPGLPTTLILDREGRVRHRLVGYVAPTTLRLSVERLLAEPAPEAAASPVSRGADP